MSEKIMTQEEFEFWDDEMPEPIYCQICLKRGYQIHLGPKILKPNEPRPDDYENWLECGTCGWICPIYQVEKEATIKDSIETIESPFESGKFQLETIPKRAAEQHRKPRPKRIRKDKNKLHEDKEIDALMRVYGDRVKVVYDSNP
jgi:Na+-translocating ferredoxin:NAD+ oxidoreductase RnfC subunit